MLYDVIVIGGGPAGMLAAALAGERGRSVALLEKNDRLGKKLFITGKGRCNLTNAIEIEAFQKFIPKNAKFLYSSFAHFSNQDLVHMFNDLGVKTKVERGNRVFPVSDQSGDIIAALEKKLNKSHVKIFKSQKVITVNRDQSIFQIKTLEEIFQARQLIIATGGISYPLTGSTGDGYAWAQSFGHQVTPLYPSLVPLVVAEDFIGDLQGLSLKNVAVTVLGEQKKIYEDFGELLFTHFGLSGPTILSASFYASSYLRKKKNVSIVIDLKPALTMEQLDKRLVRDFEQNLNKQFKNSLHELLPQKLISTIIRLSGIDPEKEVHQVTKLERKQLCTLLKEFKFHIVDTRPIAEAIVTSGGVKLSEINPKTMESKLVEGLYFVGELLDVDGFTGGFNLQIAFSTGYMAGISV